MCLRTFKENIFNADTPKRHQVAFFQGIKENIRPSFSECSAYSNEINTGLVTTIFFTNYSNVASHTKTKIVT
jgi:hypothetical protein